MAATPPATPPLPPLAAATPPATPPLPPPAVPQDDYDYYTLDQIKAEMKKLVWKKGDFTITPYGFLWANMVYETERSNIGDYTLYVFSSQDRGYNTFHADGKSTRLGFDFTGPRIACLNYAPSGGKLEFDFQGVFVTENKGTVLLRHAYWEVKDEQFRLLAGQTWDVISPLYPGTIMYSVYWGAGNIGYRRAQFRAERYLAFSDVFLLTAQGSINADIVTDTGTDVLSDQADWPVCEGRIALTFGPRGKNCHPIVLGVSSHIGEQRFRFTGASPANLRAKTWSLNADLKAPVNERFGFQGEYFTGENLGAYLGGILQGYNLTLRDTIYSQGGWLEVYYYWTPQWHSHVGYTLDDPLDRQISSGGRTYNQAYFGNLVYNVTKKFQLGLEVSQWRTLWQNKLPGESTRVEFMARYGF